MNNKNGVCRNLLPVAAAWGVHLFTASGAVFGFLAMILIHQQRFQQALWVMGITIIIDAVDGTWARLCHVKAVLPNFDGALLDNIIDYFNYVLVPCWFLFCQWNMLPEMMALPVLSIIILSSSYQFCQSDAKTADHFFKGFPCYWNIVVFYLYIYGSNPTVNAMILLLLSVLIFVPIKYVYPSRLDYLTESHLGKKMFHLFSALYGISCAIILWRYPANASFWSGISFLYIVVYLWMSFYRTLYPMIRSKLASRKE